MSTFEEYERWTSLFGKSTVDSEVIAAFAKTGLDAPPVIARDEGQASIDDDDFVVAVRDPVNFGREGEFGDGVGLVAGVTIHLVRADGGGYKDKLPFGIHRDDTREQVSEKLGEPENSTRRSDMWLTEDRKIIVGFAGEPRRIKTVSVFLPDTI